MPDNLDRVGVMAEVATAAVEARLSERCAVLEARLENRYPKAWHGTEMFLVSRADENAKVEMTRGCGDGEIVGRYHPSPLAEQRE
jgi:hypothetical protein